MDRMKEIGGVDGVFVGVKAKGEEAVFYKLLEFDLPETGKHYLVYTDKERDEEGMLNIYAATVEEQDALMHFGPITSEVEWDAINYALGVLEEQMKEDE